MKSMDLFISRLKEQEKEKEIFVFGAGTYGKICGEFLEQNKILWRGFIDSNLDLIGSIICGKKVFALDSISNRNNVFIIISLSSLFYKNAIEEIKEKFIKLGVYNDDIFILSDDLNLVNEMVCCINNSKDILKRNEVFKKKYEGERCFIIGNGPSLTINDLNRLKNDITMGCNGILNLFDKTQWRPTFFFCEDNLFLKKYVSLKEELEVILSNCAYVFTTLRSNLYEKYKDQYDNLFFLHAEKVNYGEMQISDDICKSIYGAGTTLYSMIQLALYMGIKEIYLLGVDSAFKKEMYADGTLIVNGDVSNHMKMMEQMNEGQYLVDLMMEGWLCAKAYADAHGIKICNVTRGGKLEVFERVNFDDLF